MRDWGSEVCSSDLRVRVRVRVRVGITLTVVEIHCIMGLPLTLTLTQTVTLTPTLPNPEPDLDPNPGSDPDSDPHTSCDATEVFLSGAKADIALPHLFHSLLWGRYTHTPNALINQPTDRPVGS